MWNIILLPSSKPLQTLIKLRLSVLQGIEESCFMLCILKSTKHCVLLLFTTKGVSSVGILHWSLSDLFHLCMKGHDNLRPFMVSTMQFATGKTNYGTKLYRRVARHVDITNCLIRSIMSTFFYHFKVTKELEDPKIDFFDNSTWFDVKLNYVVHRVDKHEI